jgi:hypothetical protein
MRNVVIAAAVVGLATITANCSGPQGSNSASNMFPSLVAPSVLEARGGNGGGNNGNGNGNGGSDPAPAPIGSLSVAMVNDTGTVGVSHGDTVKFDVTGGSAPAGSLMSLNCYQGSDWVYAMGGYPAGFEFMLSSRSWPSGEADCTATLYTSTGRLASVTFHVAA